MGFESRGKFLPILVVCCAWMNVGKAAEATVAPVHLTGNSHSVTTLSPLTSIEELDGVANIEIKCASDEMRIRIPVDGLGLPEGLGHHGGFSGMIYPQGLSKNSSCLVEYTSVEDSTIEYRLPLRSCNTMTSINEKDTLEEYFNTIVVEPHPKLVTGQGRGLHVRCQYKKAHVAKDIHVAMRIRRVSKDADVTPSPLSSESELVEKEAETQHEGNIQIGDPLEIRVTLYSNTTHPFIISNCRVRDGLGWAEETLINGEGCPVDPLILPPFTYESNSAFVRFPAHKFPYSPTVYYSCAVKICPGCSAPVCDGQRNVMRSKRDVEQSDSLTAVDKEEATVQVYNGIWVNEDDGSSTLNDEIRRERRENGEILCFKHRDFALAIAFSGLFLMLAVLVLIFVLCIRKRRQSKLSESGSSIYSGTGGYTNTAYSHSS